MYELTISGPGKNALGTDVMNALLEGLAEADGRPLLLRGEGDAFSAGLNLKEIAGLEPAGMKAFLTKLRDLTTQLFDYPGPTVALVNGHAIAGGCVLLLCCDQAIATSNPRARIGLNEVALGLIFPEPILQIVKSQLPKPERVILEAGLYDPATSLALGIVDAVEEDAEAVARQRLEVLSAHPADSYAAAKASLRAGLTAVDPAAEANFERDVLPSWTGEAFRARVLAALKR